jgi:signal peptidase I
MAVPAREPESTPAPRIDGPGKHRRDRRKRSRAWIVTREFVIVIVLALALSALVRAVLLQAFYVPSASMEMTLMPSDRIGASKLTTRFGGVSRGEVVVFKDPADWLAEPSPPPDGWRGSVQQVLTFIGLLPSDTGNDLVKRVIGLGGDRVACCDSAGRIVLNGTPLDEDYIIGPTDQVRFDVEIPDGAMFVLGDNRADSRDSRYHLNEADGAVPIDNVVGRVFLVIWPFDRVSIVPIPAIFGAVND